MDYRHLDVRPQAGLLGRPTLLGQRPSPAEIGTDVRRLPPAVGGRHDDPAVRALLADRRRDDEQEHQPGSTARPRPGQRKRAIDWAKQREREALLDRFLTENWVAQLLGDVWEAVRRPGQVLSGEVPLEPGNRAHIEAIIPTVTDLAALTVGGPIAKGAVRGGALMADDAADLAGQAHKQFHTRRLSKALARENPATTRMGKIDKRLLGEINTVRKLEGEPPIGTRDIRVYEAVLRKFQEKRIGLDGLTPRQVAETIYRIVHGKGTVTGRGTFPTAQRLINEQGKGAAVGFVGRGPADDVSVKTAYRADAERLNRLKSRDGE